MNFWKIWTISVYFPFLLHDLWSCQSVLCVGVWVGWNALINCFLHYFQLGLLVYSPECLLILYGYFVILYLYNSIWILSCNTRDICLLGPISKTCLGWDFSTLNDTTCLWKQYVIYYCKFFFLDTFKSVFGTTSE